MNIKICICLAFLSCLASVLSDNDFGPGNVVKKRLAEPDGDKLGGWRIQRQNRPYQYQQPRLPRPPAFYHNNAYTQGYAPTNKPTSDSPGNPVPPRVGGGTGVSFAVPECAPGIPRCVPRVGR